MDTLLLQKDKLKDFLRSLDGATLIAPVSRSGRTRFEEIDNLDAAGLDLDDYTASPKKVMFPQTEALFSFAKAGDAVAFTEPQAGAERVVFGIRPCDAKSFVILDRLFNQDLEDPYYKKRRETTTLIGLACKEPTNRCFCPSVGGSPSGTEGLDVLFTDTGDAYYVEGISKKGEALLEKAKKVFSRAKKEDKTKKEKAAKASLEKICRSVDLKKLYEDMPSVFADGIWSDIGNKCIGCGICTYNCPTCHCFDIQDEGTLSEGRRIRVWDACMYPEFTLHASGENPRHDRGARIRNRMYHKFCYYPQNLGYIACVGCGRCIELCPVNEDLIEILNRVRATING